ncbi:T9SS type A sorting domain-containing protein, partial [bacterium]|nr:T9SS type A sorting domain-containing protein [bacterium]
ETCSGDTRLSFNLGEQAGTCWFDDIRLTTAAVQGLLPGESLEQGNVKRIAFSECVKFTDNRVRDISAFYLKLMEDYFREMSSHIKGSLGVRVPVVGTNWNVGPADLAAQSGLDYMDNHSYWDHPQFPTVAWSSTDWLVNNNAMVLDPNGGTIPGVMAGVGQKDKPFTISEYNHAFPNRYQSEGVLFITAYSAFHDADAPMFFDYGGAQTGWDTDQVDGYFGIHRNTAMMCLMPSCAFAFRSGLIGPARQTLFLDYSRDDILLLPKKDTGQWDGPRLIPKKLALVHGMRTASFESTSPFNASGLPPEPVGPYIADTGEILWDTGGLFETVTPSFIGLTGLLDRYPNHQSGDLTLHRAGGFATLTWVSVNADSLKTARRSLLTVSTRIQNTGMIWDGIHTVHNDWGAAPTGMEPASLSLVLDLKADSIRVYPLDGTGNASRGCRTLVPGEPGRFHLILDQAQDKTVWWGIENTSAPVPPETTLPSKTELLLNYPNPFNSGTRIPFHLQQKSAVRLEIRNLQGRKIRTLVDSEMPAGRHSAFWDNADEDKNPVAAGIYFIVFRAGDETQVKKAMHVE